MKLKKALSGILAAAMVVSLTPAMAFAQTSITTSGISTVSKTDTFKKVVEVEVKNDPGTWAPVQEVTFDLSTDTAKWNVNGTAKAKLEAGDFSARAQYIVTASALDAGKTSKLNGITTAAIEVSGAKSATEAAFDLAEQINGTLGARYSAVYNGDSTVTLTAKDAGAVATPPSDGSGDVSLDVDTLVDGTNAGTYQPITATWGTKANPTANLLVLEYCSTNSVTFTVPAGLQNGDMIQFTLNLKSTSTAGDVTVGISSESGDIQDTTLTIATVVKGDTVANVPDYGTDDLESVTVRNADQQASDIVIKEATKGVIGSSSQKFTLQLPKEVSWSNKMLDKNAGGVYTQFTGSLLGTVTNVQITDSDKRVLEVTFTPSGESSARRTLTISPVITTSKDAKEGEIAVKLVGDSTSNISNASGLVIATVGEADVSVYVDEDDYKDGIPALYSGLIADVSDDQNIAIITIKEKNNGDLTAGKYIDFTFDEKVQLAGSVKVAVNDGPKVTNGLDTNASMAISKNRSSFGWKVTGLVGGTTKNKIKVYIPITVEAGFEGDVVCTVSGEAAGVEETNVTVATAKPVLKVSTEVSKLRTGIQNQAIADIILTESEPGALEKGTAHATSGLGQYDVAVELPFTLSKEGTIKVTGGDLDIKSKNAKKGSNVIYFTIDSESVKEAGEITISDLEVSLSRDWAEGTYDIKAAGSAVVKNGDYNNGNFADDYKAEDVLEIITPADATTVDEKVQATFVIGEASYTNNGTATEMDAAAYIDSHNRTMVPIRYVANACGISENDIRWEAGSQTAIINGLNTVVTVKMGSNKLQTSTGEITMDTVAVNNNGRIYVPVRYIANALGANVSWDAATKTVTLTK